MDSEARIVQSMQRAFEDAELLPLPSEKISNIIGLGLIDAVRRLLPEATAQLHEEICRHYRRRYLDQEGVSTPLFNGAEAVVEELSQKDYLLAVATGKSRSGLNNALQNSGIEHMFHGTRCADETFSKPHPQMLEELIEEFAVMPSETLMIGDTEYDMRMAGNARAHGLAVSYGVHDRERLLAADALACLDDVKEIPAWIDAWERRA